MALRIRHAELDAQLWRFARALKTAIWPAGSSTIYDRLWTMEVKLSPPILSILFAVRSALIASPKRMGKKEKVVP